MRGNKSVSAHYLDGLAGCGDEVAKAIRTQFFSIISHIVEMIKTERRTSKLEALLSAVIWNYTVADFESLYNLHVFKAISEGNGDRSHPLH